MLVNRAGRHPHEVALLSVCLVFGPVGLIAKDKVSGTAIQSLPGVLGYLFFVLMTLGAGMGVAGLFLPFKGVKGPLVERTGLWLLSLVWYVYALLALATSGLRALGFALVLAGFATANVYLAVKRIPEYIQAIALAAAKANVLDELEGENP
jgi:hypothetical protein